MFSFLKNPVTLVAGFFLLVIIESSIEVLQSFFHYDNPFSCKVDTVKYAPFFNYFFSQLLINSEG